MIRVVAGAVLGLAMLTAMISPMAKAAAPFFSPPSGGGSWFDIASPGLGEPLNVSTQSGA